MYMYTCICIVYDALFTCMYVCMCIQYMCNVLISLSLSCSIYQNIHTGNHSICNGKSINEYVSENVIKIWGDFVAIFWNKMITCIL